MKNSLSEKDIKRISDRQRAEQAKRDEFESHVEVFIDDSAEHFTYAILNPQWDKLISKKWSYYRLTYYLFDPESVKQETGKSVKVMWPGEHFRKYRDFKNFLKTSSLRRPSEFELAKLKTSKTFRGHFGVSEIESIELTEDEREWLSSHGY